jgi:hypothetical protein
MSELEFNKLFEYVEARQPKLLPMKQKAGE